MVKRKLAVIGVGNMAKAVISGIVSSDCAVSDLFVFDKNVAQYAALPQSDTCVIHPAQTIGEAVGEADCVLISVKPQNYKEVLAEIATAEHCNEKLYISIGAGITVKSVSEALDGACVIRVLPNVPMVIGQGVSVICENPHALTEDFDFVCSVFRSAGSVLIINECEMNRIIGVTSSSPAYVFRFINAIYQGAIVQGLPDRDLLNVICDVVIGSALLLKHSEDTPEELIAKVASKGGTTERALSTLSDYRFDEAISEAMGASTNRAD